MPDTQRHHLPAHPARGSEAPSGCASAFLTFFGLPFMAGGIALYLVSKGVIKGKTGGMPEGMTLVLALIFFIPGLLLFLGGIRSAILGWRYKARQARHPGEPWFADAWDPEGVNDRPRHSLVSQLAATAFLTLFLTPFNYIVFLDEHRSKDVPFFAKGLVGLFDFILVLMVVGIFTTLWHKVRFGRARLTYGTFPFFVGQTVNVRFRPGRSLGQFKRLVFILRCVEERVETTRTRKGVRTQTVCDQVWADEVAFSESWALQDGEIPLSFRLPDGDYGTSLGGTPVRYWEIEVEADTPGLDYAGLFNVPVYAPPRA